MNSDLIFRLALFALLAVFVVHRGYYTKKYGRPDSDVLAARGRSTPQRLANAMSALALGATAVYLINPGLVAWAALPFPDRLRWAGAILALGGFALLQWSHAALSRNWSDQPRLLADQQLVTDGPYRRMRHPIYTAFLLILSAPLFLSANWLVGLAWLASTGLEVTSRVRYEEALLAQQFGDAYRMYASHTGRLLPRFSTHSDR